jgi:ferredoxin
MATTLFIQRGDIAAWLADTAATHTVYAPLRDKTGVRFHRLCAQDAAAQTQALELDRQAQTPPKNVLLPACETLLEFSYAKQEDGSTSLDVQPVMPQGAVLLFGPRPCDARAFTVFDRVYDAGRGKDPYYTARRAATVVASVVCTRPEQSCFCTAVGGAPDDTEGSDILFTPVQDGFIVRPLTQAGEAVLRHPLFTEAAHREEEAAGVCAAARAAVPCAPADFTAAPEPVAALFDDMEFWQSVTAKCLSCGACTYLCPTCYCFNITDESNGLEGRRLRTWDNCMSFQFTLEGSGHNPRPTKAHRYRNRIGHKFSYYPRIHDGALSCVGCGRCISSCPVTMDIRRIVHSAMQRAQCATPEQAHE